MVYVDPSSLKINKNLVPQADDSRVDYSQIKFNTLDGQQSQVMILNEEPDGIILLSIQMAIVEML